MVVWVRLACLVALVVAVGCSGSDGGSAQLEATTPQSDVAWYNSSVLRPLLGDFAKVEQQIDVRSDIKLLTGFYQRGKYLVRGPAACGVCHAAEAGDAVSTLSGGRLMTDGFGKVHAANITPDITTGIGEWTVAEVVRALRASIDRQGRPLSLDMHRGYRWMSDRDARSVAVFLLASEPMANKVERRELGPFERNRWGIVPQHQEIRGYTPQLPERADKHYGRYLANNVAQCQTCHTRGGGWLYDEVPFAGSSIPTRYERAVELPMQLLTTLFGRPAEVDESTKSLISRSGQAELDRKAQAAAAAQQPEEPAPSAEQVYQEALDNGDFPMVGPDIRGNSPDGLAQWSEEQIVEYFSSGATPAGGAIDGRFCPWPYYRQMKPGDKRAIAQFLKTL